MQFNWLVSIWWGTLVVKGLKYEPIHSIPSKNIRKPVVFFRGYKMETLARNVLKTFLLPQWCNWSILQFLKKSSYPKLLTTHFMPLISFYTSWKYQKTRGFLMFSGGRKKDRGMKWVKYYEKHKKHKKAKVFRRYRNGTLA